MQHSENIKNIYNRPSVDNTYSLKHIMIMFDFLFSKNENKNTKSAIKVGILFFS